MYKDNLLETLGLILNRDLVKKTTRKRHNFPDGLDIQHGDKHTSYKCQS